MSALGSVVPNCLYTLLSSIANTEGFVYVDDWYQLSPTGLTINGVTYTFPLSY